MSVILGDRISYQRLPSYYNVRSFFIGKTVVAISNDSVKAPNVDEHLAKSFSYFVFIHLFIH